MNLRQQLRHLASAQSNGNSDKCRLFYDGSIRTRTITDGGGEGWLLIASKINGAGPMFGHFFVGNDEQFLSMRDLRQALELRDRMFTDATQDRTLRTMREQLRKEMHDKARKASKSVRRINVLTLNKEESEREESEKAKRIESRTSPILFF